MRVYRRGKAQGGLFAYEDRVSELASRGSSLDRLDAAVEWELFRPALESSLNYHDGSKGGQPPWDPVLMLKVLILQRFHGLSDDATEDQILDRFSFQRFLGLKVDDAVPDAKTIWLFKERLGAKGLRSIFAAFDSHLRALGLIGKVGKLIDATFVEADRQRNRPEENAQIKQGERPESFDENPHRGAQKDSDARWTKKGDVSFFGYKNHVKADAVSKLIEAYLVTPASVHDSQCAAALLGPEDAGSALYADSAYETPAIRERLAELGMADGIVEQARRGRPLTRDQRALNALKTPVRARVEHLFGRIHHFGTRRLRRIGLDRAAFETGLTNLTYNLARLACLMNRPPGQPA